MKTCPLCHLMLQAFEWDGPEAWVCSSCGGIWAAADADAVAARAMEIAQRFPPTGSMGMYEGLPMSCPQCRIVRLDRDDATTPPRWRCSRCSGVWFSPLPVAAPAEPPATGQGQSTAPPAQEKPADQESRAIEAPEPADEQTFAPAAEAPTPAAPVAQPPLPVQPPSAAPVSSPVEAPWKRPETPGEALECLRAGNRRYAAGTAAHPRQDAARRQETQRGQSPFAAVLACSDSRVPPEVLFDQGIGDLFVVREAGNIVGPLAQAGLAYAADALSVPLILVLGHTGCGAVQVTVQDDGHYPYLQPVIDEIAPAVAAARNLPGDLAGSAVRENVRRVVTQLRRSNPTIAACIGSGRMALVGGIYDVATGQVEFLTDLAPFEDPTPPADPSLYARTTIGGLDKAPEVSPSAAHAANTTRSSMQHPAEPLEQTPQMPAEAPWQRHALLWCPQCRAGFAADQRFCTRCGVPLVPGAFRVPCLACGRENTIEAARCWACSADLHPTAENTAAHQAPPPVPVRFRRAPTVHTTGRNEQSCATQIVAIALLLAVATMLPQIAAGIWSAFAGR